MVSKLAPPAGTGAVQVTSIRSTLRLFLTPRCESPLSLKLEAAPNRCGSALHEASED